MDIFPKSLFLPTQMDNMVGFWASRNINMFTVLNFVYYQRIYKDMRFIRVIEINSRNMKLLFGQNMINCFSNLFSCFVSLSILAQMNFLDECRIIRRLPKMPKSDTMGMSEKLRPFLKFITQKWHFGPLGILGKLGISDMVSIFLIYDNLSKHFHNWNYLVCAKSTLSFCMKQ